MDAVYPGPFDDEPECDLSSVDVLIAEVERQAALLAAVATGGPRIHDVQGLAPSRVLIALPLANGRGYWLIGFLTQTSSHSSQGRTRRILRLAADHRGQLRRRLRAGAVASAGSAGG